MFLKKEKEKKVGFHLLFKKFYARATRNYLKNSCKTEVSNCLPPFLHHHNFLSVEEVYSTLFSFFH